MLLPQRYAKSVAAIVVVALFLLFLVAFRLQYSWSDPKLTPLRPPAYAAPIPANECWPELEYLRQKDLDLGTNVTWSRRCIQPMFGKSDRDEVKKLPGSLITQQSVLDLGSCAHEDIPPCEVLPLNVPHTYPEKQYAHIIFGVASKYERIRDSLPATAHWLALSGAELIGVVVDVDASETGKLRALEKEYADWDIKAKFTAPTLTEYIPNNNDEDRSTDRDIPIEHHHFMMIRDMMKYTTSRTQWLGILDDDTFFPSLYPIGEELSKYDHTKPFWLGGLSEDFFHVKVWGLMAFGGAGVFISMPLARKLDPVLETCIADASVDTGDGILRDCIYTKTSTKLTIITRLYQHDMLGDLSGFFESGIQPLSIHHWKSWYDEPVMAQAAVAGVCGDCYLQRWQFGENTLFANGYSITLYPEGLENIDLTHCEGTWAYPAHGISGHEYDFSFGPLRPKLEADQKKSYRLKDAVRMANGVLRQIYVYKGDVERGEMDEVVELLWEPGREGTASG
ncbi:hypothetical protein P152DRAFT_504476 [Eremomyces bilateralis CBS 781.70]|uniref:Glycosyltransferase family 31 protein n=1 Tax=Eremomyces bilateralis CBS 781.70 TaxID=1392243 RepID=A0A6G1GGL9_9PEZI|nr:uncharacterized protein P152DRAFT_504476 [Eremomyces bilateralis CBS 781.70]KAF1817076.1 hypothetical protein P152DRAFT_504476 [Eremomyces bilateralis CBS 781.70]